MSPRSRIDERVILRNEPIARSGGKPHICEELVREGGQVVYVSPQYPKILTVAQHGQLLIRKPQLRGLKWETRRVNPEVFVRGKVRHADHKTIVLNGWHHVLMNTENESPAREQVLFLD